MTKIEKIEEMLRELENGCDLEQARLKNKDEWNGMIQGLELALEIFESNGIYDEEE